MTEQAELKRRAAEAAVAEVQDGMVIGLGSGSTAEVALRILASRVASGLRISGVPTSDRTAALARSLAIPLTDFAAHTRLDLTIDGADEVELASLNLIKGLGGALLREKVVASVSRRMLIVVDASKIVPRLGRGMLPVEIAAFGWQTTIARLKDSGLEPTLRRQADGQPFGTDGGNLIADCAPGFIADPAELDQRLQVMAGVVDTGLFLRMATRVYVAEPGRVSRLDR